VLPGRSQSGNPSLRRHSKHSFSTPSPHESASEGFEINILLNIHASAHVVNLNNSYSVWWQPLNAILNTQFSTCTVGLHNRFEQL
jgi:hypothetical protein